jgi:lysyl-tRNA synthetase class I
MNRQIEREVDLIGRFAKTYRRKFSILIDRLNHPQRRDSSTDLASLRLCVEAVDMMLSNQSEITRILREIAASKDEARPVMRAA